MAIARQWNTNLCKCRTETLINDFGHMGCGSQKERYNIHEQTDVASVSLQAPKSAWEETHAAAKQALIATEVAVAPKTSAVTGEWQVEKAGGWVSLGPMISRSLLDAYHSSQRVAMYHIRGATPSEDATYEVDFEVCMQANRSTGERQAIRWIASSGQIDEDIFETRYQWELKNGAWVDFEDDEQTYFLSAWMSRQDTVRYSARGFEYELCFRRMVQINLSSGQKRHIRVKPPDSHEAQDVPIVLQPEQQNGFGQTPFSEQAATNPGASRTSKKGNRASPGAPRTVGQAGREKRWTLGQGAVRLNRPAASDTPHVQAPSQQAPDAVPTEPEMPEVPTEPELPELPAGLSWPPDPSARSAARRLWREININIALRERKQAVYRKACLEWHPDKNPTNEDVATEVFQFLQAVRTYGLLG